MAATFSGSETIRSALVFIQSQTRHLGNLHDSLYAAVMLLLVFQKGDQDIIHTAEYAFYPFEQLRHLPHEDARCLCNGDWQPTETIAAKRVMNVVIS